MTDQQPLPGQPDFRPPGSEPTPPPGQQFPPPGSEPTPPPGQQFPPPGQQFPPPAPPKGGRGSIWLGIGITFGAVLGWWGLTAAVPYDSPLASALNSLILLLPVALVMVGIVLAAIPRTTRTGAGVLIGIGAGILILGGLCIAIFATFSG